MSSTERKIYETERQGQVEELKEICQEIGCSGLDPDMCQNNPHHCKMIQKLCSKNQTAERQKG